MSNINTIIEEQKEHIKVIVEESDEDSWLLNLENHHTQSIQQILDSEIERLKAIKTGIELMQEPNDIHESGKLVGQIKVLDDQITHLTNIIKEIK